MKNLKTMITEDKDTRRALNDLARHQTICNLYRDILTDMMVCEIEGWDKKEYLNQLKSVIEYFIKEKSKDDFMKLCEDEGSSENPYKWTPCSERLPKENEYVGDVCKYYLIQDEYGDMYVAHLSSVGWIPINSLKAISDEVIAWLPLPKPYRTESEGNNEI